MMSPAAFERTIERHPDWLKRPLVAIWRFLGIALICIVIGFPLVMILDALFHHVL